MDKERIDVADSKIARRHARPARAAIAADTKSGRRFRPAIGRRGGAINLARIVGRNQHAMRIGIDVVDGRPSLAAIGTAQKPADFHSDMNDVRIFGMKRDAFDVRLVRRTWKSPFFHAWYLAQS